MNNATDQMIELFSYQFELSVIVAALCVGLIINCTLLIFIISRIKSKDQLSIAPDEQTNTSELSTDAKQALKDISNQLPRTVIHRYNPFRDSGVGGKQSFSLAMINTNGDGVIISQLFSREFSRVSAKEITNWESDLELSPEEQQVLTKVKAQK